MREKNIIGKLSAFAGNNLVYMGLLQILLGIITTICFSETKNYAIKIGIFITYIVIVTFFSIRVTLTLKKYEICKEDEVNT